MIRKFIGIVCLVGMVGCATAGQTFTWQDIKKEVGPTAPKPVTDSYLEVYTKVEEFNDGGEVLGVRGIPYTIFSSDGNKTKWVRNDSSTPDLVTLPPGKYVIVPDGTENKEIIGAILEKGKLTEVHLMGGAYDNQQSSS